MTTLDKGSEEVKTRIVEREKKEANKANFWTNKKGVAASLLIFAIAACICCFAIILYNYRGRDVHSYAELNGTAFNNISFLYVQNNKP